MIWNWVYIWFLSSLLSYTCIHCIIQIVNWIISWHFCSYLTWLWSLYNHWLFNSLPFLLIYNYRWICLAQLCTWLMLVTHSLGRFGSRLSTWNILDQIALLSFPCQTFVSFSKASLKLSALSNYLIKNYLIFIILN